MPLVVALSEEERAILEGVAGSEGARMALSIVCEAARILGADRLVPIESAHIDGCLYHGHSGTLFCERLVETQAKVAVPATTNVGSLNLLKPDQARLHGDARKLAYRLMVAHERLGCRPSWTCAPYQAGARPQLGQQVAWGESNAVAFCNTVLGARTNRYGDFLDIACAISGRAPFCGLHRTENRHATVVLDLTGLPDSRRKEEVFFPVLGALIGEIAGSDVPAIVGLLPDATEDQLKALCAAAAAKGAVGLMHLVGITPEAPDLDTALGGAAPRQTVGVTMDMLITARDSLNQADSDVVDVIALGSPHFSIDECRSLLELSADVSFRVPVFVCLGRHTLEALRADGSYDALSALGVEFVVDTCVVVTPILPDQGGVLMTNSAKFAHYATGNTGYLPVFGALADCVASAQSGRIRRVSEGWA